VGDVAITSTSPTTAWTPANSSALDLRIRTVLPRGRSSTRRSNRLGVQILLMRLHKPNAMASLVKWCVRWPHSGSNSAIERKNRGDSHQSRL